VVHLAEPAFISLNRDLIPAITANTTRTAQLRSFDPPVRRPRLPASSPW